MQRSCWTNGWWKVAGTACLLAFSFTGCGGGSTEQPAAVTPAANNAVAKNTPQDAVRKFLQAIKDGDNQTADAMLTKLARDETKRADLHVAPPGSPTASFEVGQFETQGDEAQVFCTWNDTAEDGTKHSDKIVWILRNTPTDGWRIAGMATEIFPGEDPLILNFEDPADMIKKQQAAEAEMVRRATETIKQAQTPNQPATK